MTLHQIPLNFLIYEENFLFIFISVVYPLNNIAYCWPIFLSVMLAQECYPYTDIKENQIFLIHKEIQNRAVARSYMTNGLLIYGEIFAHFLIY